MRREPLPRCVKFAVRIVAAHDYIKPHPVFRTWSYKLDKAALYDSKFKNAELDNVSHRSKS
jgi:hypothetical protein